MVLRSCMGIVVFLFVASGPAVAQNEAWRGGDDAGRTPNRTAQQQPAYPPGPYRSVPRQPGPYQGGSQQPGPYRPGQYPVASRATGGDVQASQQPVAGQSVPYPVRPPDAPTIHYRNAPSAQQAGPPQRPPRPPFVLSPQQQQQVDWVLQRWEQQNRGIKTFECNFTRFEYDRVFGNASKPKYTDTGRIWYSAPDRGRFEVHGERAEKWICDGKAIFEYSYQKKQVIQHDLPPEMRGKAISEGPLPFLFGSTAESLKQRYFIRLIAPPQGVEGQVWLEAYPATQQGLANFKRAELILETDGMRPYALQIYLPNGNRTAYRFTDLKINPNNLLGGLFGPDPYKATVPTGWQKIVEPVPVAQNRDPAAGQTPTGARSAPLRR